MGLDPCRGGAMSPRQVFYLPLWDLLFPLTQTPNKMDQQLSGLALML